MVFQSKKLKGPESLGGDKGKPFLVWEASYLEEYGQKAAKGDNDPVPVEI